MNAIAEIKTKIKNGDINEAMSMAMTEAMKIELTTSLTESPDQQSNIYFRTVIDLLENEIDNEFSQSLTQDGTTKKLEKIHFQEVQIAHERILQNIKSLQEMFALLEENIDK